MGTVPLARLRRPAVVLGAVAVVTGTYLAARTAWTCDDAFISYRYAENLVEGHGLVYNSGERVEGFTNLLWTLWIAAGLLLGAPAEAWSVLSGVSAGAGVLLLLLRFHLELRQRVPDVPWLLPVACLLTALNPDWIVYTTGGLETALFTLVVFAGYGLLAATVLGNGARAIPAGLILGTSFCLRPDGLLFAFVAVGLLVVSGRSHWASALRLGLVVLAFVVGVTIFRRWYYGDYVPNTYYAKSAQLAWYEQGLIYLGTYLEKYWVLLAAPLLGVALTWKANREREPADASAWLRVHASTALAFVLVYGLYVVRVGGDFMYARLFVPLTPLLGVLCELALYRLSSTRLWLYLQVVAATLLFQALTPRPVGESKWVSGIADEHAVYHDKRVQEDREKAAVLARFFHDLPVRIAFLGSEARIMYEAKVPIAIEADTGLTDRTIGRQRIDQRTRVGHEKHATVDYLVSERRAHFAFAPAAAEVLRLDDKIPAVTLDLGTLKGRVLHWDPILMSELERRGAIFTNFPAELDAYVATMSSRTQKQVTEDYAKFKLFYFSHLNDSKREEPFRRRLGL